MQAVYAWYLIDLPTNEVYELNLKETGDQIHSLERKNGDAGDYKLLKTLFFESIERRTEFDQLITSKAENWELERIALIDRILMQLAICEMLEFQEIPIKVTINEYLEIAKKYSTPKSSKFINGILDALYAQFKEEGLIQKSGRGLIETSLPKRGPGGGGYKRKRPRRPMDSNRGQTPRQGPPRAPRPRSEKPHRNAPPPRRDFRDGDNPPPPREERPLRNDAPPSNEENDSTSTDQ